MNHLVPLVKHIRSFIEVFDSSIGLSKNYNRNVFRRSDASVGQEHRKRSVVSPSAVSPQDLHD